ncbi:MAG: Gfo/Idh/MocA family oxidoreductase [Clostridia bacterium]|nr:Gfo/Idh/MocA family oxidoreductase [Clostridia bacterium]
MKHKLGVIGYGTMGSWHAENVRNRIGDLDVAAVYDIDKEKREKAKADGFSVCDTAEDFFKTDIDLVLIATPNNFHQYYSIMAMEKGKNVVCEKPACLSVEELEEVLAVSRKTGKLYTVHQNRRFDMDYVIAKKIISEGKLGKLFMMESRLYSNRGFSKGGWKAKYETGGGLLYDWGIHMLDQILEMIPENPISVYADLHKVYMQEVDDVCSVTITFESGLTARFLCDLWCHIKEARWHIQGDKGTAVIYDWFGQQGKIFQTTDVGVEESVGCIYTHNGLSTSMYSRPIQELNELPLPLPENPPRWEEFYENVIDAIEGKAKQIVTHEQILKDMKVLMAAFESANNQKLVKISL